MQQLQCLCSIEGLRSVSASLRATEQQASQLLISGIMASDGVSYIENSTGAVINCGDTGAIGGGVSKSGDNQIALGSSAW